MKREQWTEVDRYITDLMVPADEVLDAALAESAAAGLPDINVAPNQGKLLHLMALMQGARRILEIGTLGGYSTIWLGRALPADGKLISLEAEERHATVARRNIERAGLAELVEVKVGPAVNTLAALIQAKTEPFDFIFIDADKPGYPDYFTYSLKLSRKGTVIVADNVVREGAVAHPHSRDERVQGVRKYNELLAAEPRVSATVVQTVGSKGYDGFAVAVVLA